MTTRHRTFSWFAASVLLYNLPVVLWGAYVRVSFSGDGCGAHWPFCQGQVIPANMQLPTLIELAHRITTGLDVALVLGLCVWAFAAFPKGHAVRRFAVLSLAFLFVEAILGAGLVLLRLVAHDQSTGRALYLSAHLTNTLLLLGALAATAWAARESWRDIAIPQIGSKILAALAIVALTGVTGAIAALGDTLFPATSLAAGIQRDFASSAHLLVRLRLFHPVVAVSGAAYLLWAAGRMANRSRAATVVVTLTVVQVAAGVVNIGLLAPIWMQLLHLLLADLLWIAVVFWALESTQARRDLSGRADSASTLDEARDQHLVKGMVQF